MTPEYAAGLFDGEGSVAIYRHANKAGYVGSTLIAYICNTDPRPLIQLHSLFGGGLNRRTRGKAHWRQLWDWRLCGATAERFLRWIEPFSVIKPEQIACALEYRETCRPKAGMAGVNRRLSEEQQALRLSYFLRLKELKRVEYA